MTDPIPAPASGTPESPPSTTPAAAPKKKPGPIRWGMIGGVAVLWIGTGLALFLLRDRIVRAGVESGGRSAFQTAVTVDEARSGLSPARSSVALTRLQVPDRADLSRNAIQVEELQVELSVFDLLGGQVHLPLARAKGVALNVPRATPAEPLPLGGEPAPVTSEDGGQGFLEGLLAGEGSLLKKLQVSQQPLADILKALDLESVRYAEGLPARIAQAEREWGQRLEAQRAELAALQTRGQDLKVRVPEQARQIQAEWTKAVEEKKKTIDGLEASLKKDKNALGPNPATDIPRRVQEELASLDQVRAREEQRAAGLRQEVGQLEADVKKLAEALQRLDQDARQAQAELAAEAAKARKAGEADLAKVRRWVDPSGAGAEELLQVLVGPKVAAQVKSGRKWVGLLWGLLPPKAQRLTPPRSAREGLDVPIPPPPEAEQAAREAAARLLIDDLELEGALTLDEGPLTLTGHLRNLSDAPWLIGREIGLDLACALGTGQSARQFSVKGGLTPASERVQLQVGCAGLKLEGLVLREGAPAPGDLFPRRVASTTLDLQLAIDSSPERFTTSTTIHLKELSFDPIPAGGDVAPAVLAVRSVLGGVKELHLAIEVALPKQGAPTFKIEDKTQPSVLESMRAAVGKAVKEEVERLMGRYEQELNGTLAGKSDAAGGALEAAKGAWSKNLGGAQGELGQVSPGQKPLDQALAGGDQARKSLAEDAVPRLLKAAAQGGLSLPKLPFGKD